MTPAVSYPIRCENTMFDLVLLFQKSKDSFHAFCEIIICIFKAQRKVVGGVKERHIKLLWFALNMWLLNFCRRWSQFYWQGYHLVRGRKEKLPDIQFSFFSIPWMWKHNAKIVFQLKLDRKINSQWLFSISYAIKIINFIIFYIDTNIIFKFYLNQFIYWPAKEILEQ